MEEFGYSVEVHDCGITNILGNVTVCDPPSEREPDRHGALRGELDDVRGAVLLEREMPLLLLLPGQRIK